MTTTQTNKLPKNVLTAAWAIALGAIAPMLDSTMINIAIDDLTKTFHTTLNLIQWGITGYILALAMAVPVAGWLMNQLNGKRVFIGAVIAFGLTSIVAGFSWNIESFIFFRLLQGFSAGIITPLMSTLLVKTAGQENIGRVISIVTTPMIFGPILGPVIGGFIIQFASWRWIFFINVFVVGAAVPLMMRTIPEFMPFNKNSRLDGWGIALLSLLSATLIYGITKAADYGNFTNPETLIWGGIGVGLLIGYIVYDRFRGHQTVFPLELFKHRNFAASGIGLFLANIAIMGPMLIFPLFFQTFRHYTAIEAAIAMIPQGLGMLITRPIIGRMIDRIGARDVVLVSLVLALIGSIPLVFITAQTNILWIGLLLFFRGASVGGINLPLTSDAYMGLADKQLPEAGVGVNIIENLGSSFGSAVIATIVVAQGTMTSITGYHLSFLFSSIVLLLIGLPALFLTNKRTSK